MNKLTDKHLVLKRLNALFVLQGLCTLAYTVTSDFSEGDLTDTPTAFGFLIKTFLWSRDLWRCLRVRWDSNPIHQKCQTMSILTSGTQTFLLSNQINLFFHSRYCDDRLGNFAHRWVEVLPSFTYLYWSW